MAWTSAGVSHDDLIDKMVARSVLPAGGIERAFRTCDRGFFLPPDFGESAYTDSPLRNGCVHQSAPHMYAMALDSLELRPGLSFLNIGSGTGYFNSLVGVLIGPGAVNHGIEIQPSNVALARASVERLVKRSRCELGTPEFFCGNVFHLNPTFNRKYDRLYWGAGASREDMPLLLNLLTPGGVAVVPLDSAFVRLHRLPETSGERRSAAAAAAAGRGRGGRGAGMEAAEGGWVADDAGDDEDGGGGGAGAGPPLPPHTSVVLAGVAFAPLICRPGEMPSDFEREVAEAAAAAAASPAVEAHAVADAEAERRLEAAPFPPEPETLMALCRRAVRQLMADGQLADLVELPLPPHVKVFLNFGRPLLEPPPPIEGAPDAHAAVQLALAHAAQLEADGWFSVALLHADQAVALATVATPAPMDGEGGEACVDVALARLRRAQLVLECRPIDREQVLADTTAALTCTALDTPQRVRALITRSQVQRKGEDGEADLKRALELDPNNDEAQEMLSARQNLPDLEHGIPALLLLQFLQHHGQLADIFGGEEGEEEEEEEGEEGEEGEEEEGED